MQSVKRGLALAVAVFAASGAWADFSRTNPVTGATENYKWKFTGTDTWGNVNYWENSDGGHPSAVPATSGSNEWNPILFDGNDPGKTIAINAGLNVEGWNLRMGLYNGANITLNSLVKLQGGAGQWITVDDSSRLTIAGFNKNNGNLAVATKFYVANENGISWTVNFAMSKGTDTGHTSEYYFSGDGSVSYQGISASSHKIKRADVTLSGGEKTVLPKKLVSFTSSSKTFSADATIYVKDSNGTVVREVPLSSVGSSLTLSSSASVGDCQLVQSSDGVYLYYVDGTPDAIVKTDFTVDGDTSASALELPTEETQSMKLIVESPSTVTFDAGVTTTTLTLSEGESEGTKSLTLATSGEGALTATSTALGVNTTVASSGIALGSVSQASGKSLAFEAVPDAPVAISSSQSRSNFVYVRPGVGTADNPVRLVGTAKDKSFGTLMLGANSVTHLTFNNNQVLTAMGADPDTTILEVERGDSSFGVTDDSEYTSVYGITLKIVPTGGSPSFWHERSYFLDDGSCNLDVEAPAAFFLASANASVRNLSGNGSITQSGTRTLTVAPGTACEFSGVISGPALTVGGSAPLTLSGANTANRTLRLNKDSQVVLSGTWAGGNYEVNGELTLAGATAATLANKTVTGAGTLVFQQDAPLATSGANLSGFTGTIVPEAGALNLGTLRSATLGAIGETATVTLEVSSSEGAAGVITLPTTMVALPEEGKLVVKSGEETIELTDVSLEAGVLTLSFDPTVSEVTASGNWSEIVAGLGTNSAVLIRGGETADAAVTVTLDAETPSTLTEIQIEGHVVIEAAGQTALPQGIALQPGASLTVVGADLAEAMTVAAGQTLTLRDATVTKTLDVSGALCTEGVTEIASSGNQIHSSGTLTVLSGTTTLSGGFSGSGAYTVSGGTLAVTSALSRPANAKTTIEAGATLDVSAKGARIAIATASSYGSGTSTVTIRGTLVAKAWTYGDDLGNLGWNAPYVSLDGGTIRLTGSGTADRGFTVTANGGTLETSGAWTFDYGEHNYLNLPAGTTLALAGTGSVLLTQSQTASGTVEVASGATFGGAATLGALRLASGATLDASQLLVVEGAVDAADGVIVAPAANAQPGTVLLWAAVSDASPFTLAGSAEGVLYATGSKLILLAEPAVPEGTDAEAASAIAAAAAAQGVYEIKAVEGNPDAIVLFGSGVTVDGKTGVATVEQPVFGVSGAALRAVGAERYIVMKAEAVGLADGGRIELTGGAEVENAAEVREALGLENGTSEGVTTKWFVLPLTGGEPISYGVRATNEPQP